MVDLSLIIVLLLISFASSNLLSLFLYLSTEGGGCGVGFGLGWGFGNAFGSQYQTSKTSFQGIEFSKRENGTSDLSDPNPASK